MPEFFEESQFLEIARRQRPLLDVRSEIEFQEGHLGGSLNLPILNTQERVLVGTCYKERGSEAAVALGHELVQGSIKQTRVSTWEQFFRLHPDGLLFCWRGGLRSGISQQWLSEVGIHVPRVRGGYKAVRKKWLEALSEVAERRPQIVVAGLTGSGKSRVLTAAAPTGRVIDLEAAASHRGSAFGLIGDRQPSQASFENVIAASLIRADLAPEGLPLIVEDESRMVGALVVPQPLWEGLRRAPLVWIEEPLEVRVQNLLEDYVLNTALKTYHGRPESALLADRYRKAIQNISQKLGGLKTSEVLRSFDGAFVESEKGSFEAHREWIRTLLSDYYDRLYLKSISKRSPSIIFRGSASSVTDFLVQTGTSGSPLSLNKA